MRRPATRGGLATAAFGLMLLGCVPGVTSGGIARADAPPVPFPECRADAYEFAGESTFNALGLTDALPAEPPTPDRPAMIWVTRDAVSSHGTRMMCYEFPDGSGGSDWPVDDDWQLPTAGGSDATSPDLPPGWVLVGIAVVAAIGVSALAFRRRA